MINPIKFLKTYLYSYEASPITKINQIKQNDLLLSLNSQNKKKPIFYNKKNTGCWSVFKFYFCIESY